MIQGYEIYSSLTFKLGTTMFLFEFKKSVFYAVMRREYCNALVSEGKISCANCLLNRKAGKCIRCLAVQPFFCVSTVV